MPFATRFVLPALAALSLLGALARAQVVLQAPVHVDSGAVLRVTTRDGAVVQGPLVSWSPVGVTLASRERDGANPSTLRLADLQTVEVRSVSRRTLRGAATGLVAGAFVGLMGAGLGCANQGGRGENYCAIGYVFLPPVFGAMGLVAGTVIGAMVHSESWKPVQFEPR